MTVSIIVPAFNIKPALAKKFEKEIAKVMHRKREEEVLQSKSSVPFPVNTERTGCAKGRPNNATDEQLLKLLRTEELPQHMIAKTLGMSRQLVRHSLSRLYARGALSKWHDGRNYLWKTKEEENE